jgi:hypothetical protein
MRSVRWQKIRPNDCGRDCNVDDFALTPAERRLLEALNQR